MYHIVENDLHIDCKVSANPRPTIVWLKNNEPIEFDERIQQIENTDGTCELIINKPTPETDNGQYMCTATNILGSSENTHLVDFHPPPSIAASRRESGLRSGNTTDGEGHSTSKEDDDKGSRSGRVKTKSTPEATSYTPRHVKPTQEEIMKAARSKVSFVTHLTNRVFTMGSRIKLACVVQGPDVNVKWYKNEQPLVYGPRVRNMSHESLCVLEIQNCTLDDSGVYLCVARNTESDASCECRLTVFDPRGTADLSPTFTRSLKGQSMRYFRFLSLSR